MVNTQFSLTGVLGADSTRLGWNPGPGLQMGVRCAPHVSHPPQTMATQACSSHSAWQESRKSNCISTESPLLSTLLTFWWPKCLGSAPIQGTGSTLNPPRSHGQDTDTVQGWSEDNDPICYKMQDFSYPFSYEDHSFFPCSHTHDSLECETCSSKTFICFAHCRIFSTQIWCVWFTAIFLVLGTISGVWQTLICLAGPKTAI